MSVEPEHERRGRRPRGRETLVAAAYGVFALALAVISATPPLQTPLWLSAALLLSGTGLLLVRAQPVLAFAGGVVVFLLSLAGGTGAESIVLVVALYRVGARRSAVMTWICFSGAALAGALAAWIHTERARDGAPLWEPTQLPVSADPFNDWLNAALVIVVPLLITALFGVNAGQRRRHIRALVDRARQLERERDQQAEIAGARERERIAREMHDVIAHSLSVMVALAEGAHASAPTRPEQSRDAVHRVAETGRQTLGEVRRLLAVVQGDPRGSSVEQPQPDAPDLPDLVEGFRQAGLPVRLVLVGTPPLNPALGLTVYRIVQESLTNALRYARNVHETAVSVSWNRGEVTIVAEDDGDDPTAVPGDGRGIVGMKERAALFGGSVAAGPREDGGWRVVARLYEESIG